MAPFVPDDFPVPDGLRTDRFLLEPLGVRHNAADLEAWTSSVDHIRATPGFAGRDWPPRTMSPEDNEADLAAHAADFSRRAGFTYTVLDPGTGAVIGCVYIYPPRPAAPEAAPPAAAPAAAPAAPPAALPDAAVRSWVRVDRADLDRPLWEAVSRWLAEDWPFERISYSPRSG